MKSGTAANDHSPFVRPGHTEGEAQRRGAGADLFAPRGMARRGRGKRSATTFVDGTTAATSMSCNSDKGRSAGPRRKLGEQPRERNACGGDISVLSLRAASRPVGALLTLPHVPRRLVSVATRCVFWTNSMETVEASTTCPDHSNFERTLYGSPIACDPRITTITDLLPAAANAIRRSPEIVCDP